MKNGKDEVVHDYMMRELIEEIQRNVKKWVIRRDEGEGVHGK